MTEPCGVEVEPEVRERLEKLGDFDYGRVLGRVRHLAENAETLGMPHSRPLGGKLRELRFDLGDQTMRITYWLAPGRRVILLTVFAKTRQREDREVKRAHTAQRLCAEQHAGPAEHVYDREEPPR